MPTDAIKVLCIVVCWAPGVFARHSPTEVRPYPRMCTSLVYARCAGHSARADSADEPARDKRMTLCLPSILLFVMLVGESSVLADAHAGSHRPTPAAPPGPGSPNSTAALGSQPMDGKRKCGHQPLPLSERLHRHAELRPALSRLRQADKRGKGAAGQPFRRRLQAADSTPSGSIVIDVYWHIVANSGAPLRSSSVRAAHVVIVYR